MGPNDSTMTNLFITHFFGQANDTSVPLDSRGKGQTNSRVPTGRLNECVTLLNSTRLLGVLDHLQADPVLDGPPSVEKLALCVQVALQVVQLLQCLTAHERRVAYVLKHARHRQRRVQYFITLDWTRRQLPPSIRLVPFLCDGCASFYLFLQRRRRLRICRKRERERVHG